MPSAVLRNKLVGDVRSVVVKIGTALLTDAAGGLDRRLIGRLARQIADLNERDLKVTVVSSGAVGAGMGRSGLAGRPRSLPMLQATAAIGQPALMALYERAFARHGLHVGQVLVTRTDFEHRARYLNISNTIKALHRLHAVPIINENDTISVDELDRFADNDTIAALITNLLRADVMILLTVVDGLLDARGRRIDLVPDVGEVLSLAHRGRSALGSGGMASKLAAARLVTDAGEGAIIANGRQRNVLGRLLAGERIGTVFVPASRKRSGRQRWLAHAVRPVGTIMIDDGAVRALRDRGKSLLARGIISVEGRFERGAVIRIVTPENRTIAHGLSNYRHVELKKIKGLKSSDIVDALGHKPFDEAVHRDNLALTVSDG